MLQSLGSRRVGHDLVTEQQQYITKEYENLETFASWLSFVFFLIQVLD